MARRTVTQEASEPKDLCPFETCPGSEEIPVEREGTKERTRKEMEMVQESRGMGQGKEKEEEKEWVGREDMVSPAPQ